MSVDLWIHPKKPVAILKNGKITLWKRRKKHSPYSHYLCRKKSNAQKKQFIHSLFFSSRIILLISAAKKGSVVIFFEIFS